MFMASPKSPHISQLRRIYDQLQQELKECPVPVTIEKRKQEIVNLLHEFNDIKDAAQIVIGALANMEDKTIKEIHLMYDLPIN